MIRKNNLKRYRNLIIRKVIKRDKNLLETESFKQRVLVEKIEITLGFSHLVIRLTVSKEIPNIFLSISINTEKISMLFGSRSVKKWRSISGNAATELMPMER